ncbi:MAG TPA: SDR family oxidoreductase [Terriglobales bacterium]|nr:SDR family oxidoreductase [Terriglobales bacterium]
MAARKVPPPAKAKVVPLLPPIGPSRLAGKVAVVTGASRGIGYAIAHAVAMEGGDVVITGRDLPNLTKSAAQLRKEVHGPAKIVAMACDVRAPESVARMFAVVKRRFGRLDILVNNAGISQPPTPLQETTLEMWREQIDINLTGMFLCTRAALPLMQRGATIVNNLSVAAKQVFPGFAAYTAAKTGAYGFTLSIRDELMSRGIRVTALMPGATSTALWDQVMPGADRDRMINVEQVAQAVLYAALLPPEANLSELLITPTAGAV